VSKTQLQGLRAAVIIACAWLGLSVNALGAVAGSTAGNLSVTPAGTASYNIPIAIPPGSAGMAPSLAIQYSNGAGNGLLGVGWSLTGLSSISRCARTIAQDTVHGGIDLTANDRFCLDGQRLMLKPGAITTYGAANTVYGTELETLAKVTAIGTTGSGPSSFTVLQPDGSTRLYGATADSQMTLALNSVTSVVNWALNKVTDARGNYYIITYTKDVPNNQYYVKQVDYTGNAIAPALSPYNSVKFNYDFTRSDVESGYNLGTKSLGTARMINIQTYAGTTLVRTYSFGYDVSTPTVRSRLTSISECDGAGLCHTPTTFSYNNDVPNLGGASYSTGIVFSTTGISHPYETWADVNGDGRPDFCYLLGVGTPPTMASTSQYYPSYDLHCLLSTATGFGSDVLVVSGLLGKSLIQFIDINADGKTDACVNNTCYLSTGTTFNTAIALPARNTVSRLQWFVDLEGRGLNDLCYVDVGAAYKPGFTPGYGGISDTNIYCARNSGNGFGAPASIGTIPEILTSGECQWGDPAMPTPLYCPLNLATWADISGDGIPSLCVRDTDVIWSGSKLVPAVTKAGRYHCRKYLAGTLGPDIATPAAADLGWEDSQIFVDVNGDGKADFCRIMNDKTPACTLSTGTGWGETITSTVTFTVANSSASNHASVNWADVNGDGKVDVCGRYYDTVTLLQTYACLPIQSTASGAQFSPVRQLISTTLIGDALIDWNGDGLSNFCGSSQCTSSTQNYPDLLNSITNGLGAISSLSYSTLADTNIYTKGAGATYPQLDVQDSSHVVSALTSSDGIGGANTTGYHYYYGRSDLQGRGFLGYQVMDSAPPNGLYNQTWFLQPFPYTGSVGTALTYRRDNWAVLSRTDNYYTTKSLGAGRNYVHATSSTAKAYDYNGAFLSWVESSSTPSFDTANPNDAMLLTQAETASTKDSTGTLDGYSTTTTTTFQNTPATWLLGLPTSITITKAMSGAVSLTRNTVMSYFTNGLLKQSIVEPNNGGIAGETTLKLQTDYTYDPKFGNLATATVSGANIVTRKTTDLTYDAKGQFVSASKNALGHNETRTYDERFGSIKSLTGPNLLPTNWTYDGFGRMATETRADGTRTTVTYTDCPGCWSTLPYLRYTSAKTDTVAATGASISPTTVTINDIFGRAFESYYLSFDGVNNVFQDWRYDNLGRLSTQYAPYKAGDTLRPVTTAYDNLNRPTSTTYPDGSITTYAYNGLTSSKTNSKNQITSETRNSQGQVASVVNAQGTADQSSLSYAYDVWGNLAQTTDSLSNSVKMTYDLRGRKKTLADPDMGNWSYTYDNLGLLKTQTDAKTQTSSFTYDVLDRMTVQSTPSLISNWYYESNKALIVCAKG
jgi:YD repeat-containing protein